MLCTLQTEKYATNCSVVCNSRRRQVNFSGRYWKNPENHADKIGTRKPASYEMVQRGPEEGTSLCACRGRKKDLLSKHFELVTVH